MRVRFSAKHRGFGTWKFVVVGVSADPRFGFVSSDGETALFITARFSVALKRAKRIAVEAGATEVWAD
jgi:lipocalin